VPNQKSPESDSDVAARVTVEIRLRAVTEVIDGAPVVEVAERYGVTRQTVTAWRKRYEAGGLDALADQCAARIPAPAGSHLMSKH
jgi:transposase-like protein